MVDAAQFRENRTIRTRVELMDESVRMPDSLPERVLDTVWRIFGRGASPYKRVSAFELIKPVMGKVLGPGDQTDVISEVENWFEHHGAGNWLRPELREPVARSILEGARGERSDTAVWAVGSMEPELALRLIGELWSQEEIDSFVSLAIKVLEKLCVDERLLDVERLTGLSSKSATVALEELLGKGRLERFRELESRGRELVHWGLHHAAGHVIEIAVRLRPDEFETIIRRLAHPVVQARAAEHMIAGVLGSNHRVTLNWISQSANDPLVAIAILYSLVTVNGLDRDLEIDWRVDPDQTSWSTELRPPEDDLDRAATDLLVGLVERLGELGPLACVGWIGELLRAAPLVLNRTQTGEAPRRIQQLEKQCTKMLSRIVCESWSDDLIPELCAGLRSATRDTWPRHVAMVAWSIRDDDPERAEFLAQWVLKTCYEAIGEQVDQDRVYMDWSDYQYREWIEGLSACLVLSAAEVDVSEWVTERCKHLKLSVWDAEADVQSFMTADKAVQTWFLAAFHTIVPRQVLGRAPEAAGVRKLTERLWDHNRFAMQFVPYRPESANVEEFAARYGVEVGEVDDGWILRQASRVELGPRSLWALADQLMKRQLRGGEADNNYAKVIMSEFMSVGRARFSEPGELGLEQLFDWGGLWLLLEAVDEAEQTAKEIIELSSGTMNRAAKILVLRLLTLVASERRLAPALSRNIDSMYRELWFGHTPAEERTDRARIDEILNVPNSAIS